MKDKRLLWILGAAGVSALGALFYLLSNPSDSPRRAVFKPGWELCEAGDSCVAVAGPCGEWKPVNSAHEDESAAYYRHLISVVEKGEMICMERFHDTTKPPALCISGSCELAE